MDASPERSDRRLAGWLLFVAFLIALNVANRLSGAARPEEPLYSRSFLVGGAITWAVFAGIVLLIAAGATSLFALRRSERRGRTTVIAVATVVVVIAIGAALRALGANPTQEQGLIPQTWPPPSLWVLAGNFLIVAAVAPVVEELTFRGLGFSLLERFGAVVAVAGTALTFAAAHALVEGFVPIFVLGIGLAAMRLVSGSVVPSIVLHSAFNGVQLLAALAVARAE